MPVSYQEFLSFKISSSSSSQTHPVSGGGNGSKGGGSQNVYGWCKVMAWLAGVCMDEHTIM